MLDEFRTDVTKTKRDGTKGRMKIDYGDRAVDKFPEDAQRWLWKFLAGAKTAGELYSRALMVVAAERYALSRIVLPAAQRHHPQSFGSHRDIAEKMLEQADQGRRAPVAYRAQRAIDKANAELAKAEDAVRAEHSAQPEPEDSDEDEVL